MKHSINDNQHLAVAALQNGTVIDHIPSNVLFQCVKILGIESQTKNITIGNNLDSKKLGKKGIIKVADTEYNQDILNRIAIIAPTAVVNIIRDYKVVEKRQVQIPTEMNDILLCNNPKCITNNEPMPTKFHLVSESPVTLRCHYCNHTVDGKNAQIK